MQPKGNNPINSAELEALMERYKKELIGYQRATSPSFAAVNTPPQQQAAIEPPTTVILEESAEDEPITPPLEEMGCRCAGDLPYEKAIALWGEFCCTGSFEEITTASIFAQENNKVKAFIRFAADLPQGAADASRCRRSFSVKLFCEEGELDLPAQHLEAAFSAKEDILLGFSQANRPQPETALRCYDSFWRLLCQNPQAINGVIRLYCEDGVPCSYLSMNGYGLPLYMINSQGEKSVVRLNWIAQQNEQPLTRLEIEEFAGFDPDGIARATVNYIKKATATYNLVAQILPNEQSSFDPTVTFCNQKYPYLPIGVLTINAVANHAYEELLDNSFDEASLIPGVEIPPEKDLAEDGFKSAMEFLKTLDEQQLSQLGENIAVDLLRVNPTLLEEVLNLITKLDLSLAQRIIVYIGRYTR